MTDETGEQQDDVRVTAPPRPFDDEADDAPASDGDLGDTPVDDVTTEDEIEALPPVVDPGEPVAPEPFEDLSELPALLEALLFVADHPVDVGYLSRAIEVSGTRVERSLDALAESLRASQRGIRLQRGPAGVQLVSAPEAAGHVERFLGLEANRRLSTAALETLAIIAYRQPITRGQVDAVRGVSSDGAIATLRARELIEPAGHAPGPGRPMLFRTTQRFLEHFGLERPGQLPPLPDDIELPPAEIGEQLGLDEATIAEALRPLPPTEESATVQDAELSGEPSDELSAEVSDEPAESVPSAAAEAAPAAEADATVDDEIDDEIEVALASTTDVEISSDLQALSAAAGHAFEASRDRLASPPADVADDESGTPDHEARD